MANTGTSKQVLCALVSAWGAFELQAATLYSIGSPNAEEQLYVELINRARANPQAEAARLRNTTDPEILAAYRYFNVNMDLMTAQFALILPAPPLAINSQLAAAARGHSQDMLNNNFQSHTGTGGSTMASRVSAQGYKYRALGENVYAYSRSVEYGHASFEVDWGNGIGGMQTPAGHRNSIHNALYREVGIGNVKGQNGSAGPQVVTQDFGTSLANTPFITGVAYRDSNNNGFYDIGEGVGGVRVDVVGSSYYAVTAPTGGYTVPVAGNGQYTVTFSGAGWTTSQQSANITTLANVKIDYRATPSNGTQFQPLRLTAPTQPFRGQTRFEVTGTATAIDIYASSGKPLTWSRDTTAVIQQTAPSRWSVTTATSTERRLYRAVPR